MEILVAMGALIAGLITFGLSAFLTRRFCSPGSWLHVLDHPNDRSLHTTPTPRFGGVAVIVGIFVGMSIWVTWAGMPRPLGWLGTGALLVAGLSFLDDMKGLSVGARFAGHLAVSGLLVVGGVSLLRLDLPGVAWDWSGWVGGMVSMLYLIWMINLYNFMDGMDGFAGGMTVFGFGGFALLGALAGHSTFAAASLIVAAGAGGFLLFNFPPARIFMGDTGSATLGLLAGGMSLWGSRDQVFPLWVAVLVFSPFIVDATVTLIRRLLQGQKVWEAHKTHYYQRLVQAGWGHRKTVLVEYLIMLGCGITALLSLRVTVTMQVIMLAVWVLFYIIFFYWVSWYVSRHRHDSV